MREIDTSLRFKAANSFKGQLLNNSYLSNFDISFSCINNGTSEVLTLSTDYEWHLEYWESGLDLKLAQRMHKGVHSWSSYDEKHLSTLKQYVPERMTKIDICTEHNSKFELLSFSSCREISLAEINYFIEVKPAISLLARKIWKSHDNKTALPLRCQPVNADFLIQKKAKCYQSKEFYQFGDIILTNREMKTIELLIRMRGVKEIANFHNCSGDVEKKRIANIKRKLNCEGLPLSSLFDALEKNGVIFTCMAHYITSP